MERHTFHQSVTNGKCFSIKCFFSYGADQCRSAFFLVAGRKVSLSVFFGLFVSVMTLLLSNNLD